ncbi:C-terminal binding protein [Pectinatus sottacetonis]|uniref:C-terminal binding protein n=1 Tax=Pectinatus sottacetonis TaxID=1002795 RepID=UPI0018C6A908|nr:C-terminal binding protein [Pectinatus sottacetonis]
MKPVKIWIIDEEWPDYEHETALLKQELPGCEIRYSDYDYEHDLEEFGKYADIILAQIYVKLNAAVIDKLECCKGIAVYGGGYDRVDIKAARAKGISVTNVHGYCTEDIADYVAAAIYSVCKPLSNYNDSITQGLWGAQAVKNNIAQRVSAKTLFIAGFGTIGREVAKKAQQLGLNVLVYDPFVSQDTMLAADVTPVTLCNGFKQADFISIHIICTDATTNLITSKYFSLMKKTAYIINTARGKILNEQDLITAVENGEIAGAFLDVVTIEPPTGQEKIFHTKNITVTPHICYISQESYKELKERTARNAVKMLHGEIPADLVN